MPAISGDRDGILQQLESSERAAGRLVAGASHAQVNWRPTNRSWSVWQCLDHLARTNRAYCQSLLRAIAHSKEGAKATSAITPGWFGRRFIASMEPPVRTRYRAVGKVLPETEGDAQAALKDFVDSHSDARRVVASWERLDLNCVRFKNPFVPVLRFTVGTGLMIINAHDRRHLWQAERVKESKDYPAA